jgi:hypothetical protein
MKLKIGNIINIIIYSILILLLMFWNIFVGFIKISSESLFATAIGVFLFTEIGVIRELNKINDKLSGFANNEIVSSDDLNTALISAIKSKRVINHMRIFALSTNVIQPIVRSSLNSKTIIRKCSMLIRNLNDEEYEKNFGNEVISIINRWQNMKGRSISKFEITFFDTLPSDFNIIIDDDIAIIGNYIFTANDKSNITIDRVISVSNSRESGKDVIHSYIERFDKSFEYFKSVNENHIRGDEECHLH